MLLRGVLGALLLGVVCSVPQRAQPKILSRPYPAPRQIANQDVVNSAKELLLRVFPSDIANAFQLEATTSTGTDDFEIDATPNVTPKVVVRASTAANLAAGVGWYLKYVCNSSVAWSGSQIGSLVLPLPRAPQVISVKAALSTRYYLNTCTHSYTMLWWDWARWEKEIDWMALSGFNMLLAFTGQEYLFHQVFTTEFGFSQQEMDEWFTGPAFLAWGRMGNIRGYGGPLGAGWKQKQFELQCQIIKRLRELSIVAVLPGFAGHVPPAFKTHFPTAKVANLPTWAGFNSTFSGDFVLDATDPLFVNISTAIIRAQEVAYNGTDHVFNADTYNEMIPASNDTAYLTAQSSAMYASFTKQDPHAVWMIQGWMFSFDKSFWQPTQVKAYLDGVPNTGMIILDLNAFADPIWKQTSSFYGKPFIWCIINNGGQRSGMYGDLQKVINDTLDALGQSTSISGVGVAPEGTYVNYPSYELTAEMGWRSDWLDAQTWTRDYASRRYGAGSAELSQAWDLLLANVYSTPYAQDGFVINSRPSLTMGAAYGWTNLTALAQVWRLFHSAAETHGSVETFRFDYIDVVRQNMAYLFEDVYRLYVEATAANATSSMETIGEALVEMVDDLDRLLQTHAMWSVGSWLDGARQWAHVANDNNEDLLDYNARHLITVWGPNGELNGYAYRHLAGVMRDMYGARWRLFVSRTLEAVQNGVAFDQNAFDDDCFYLIEMEWANAHNIYPAGEVGSTISVAQELFEKYLRGDGTVDSLRSEFTVSPNSDGSGNVYNVYQAGTRDLGQLWFLCDTDPHNCGGFIANAYLKPPTSSPVPFKGSTLFLRK